MPSKETVKTYENRVEVLRKLLGITDGSLEFLLDYRKIRSIIESQQWADTTKKTTYVSIISIGRDKHLFSEKIILKYRNELWKYKKKITEWTHKNIKSQKQEENWIEWKKIIKLRNKLKKDTSTTRKYLKYLAICLLTYFPPRRTKDYAVMKMTSRESKTKDTNYNYCLISNGKMSFIFNNYKTNKTYGRQEFIVPKQLKKVIVNWLVHNTSQWMITTDGKSKKPMAINTFTKCVTNIFNEYLGKKASPNIFRHSFISFLNRQNISLENRKKVSKKMAHDIMTQLEYAKIDDINVNLI